MTCPFLMLKKEGERSGQLIAVNLQGRTLAFVTYPFDSLTFAKYKEEKCSLSSLL